MNKTLTLTTKESMQCYIEQVWPMLVASYAKVSGGLHFESAEQLIAATQRWRLEVRNKKVIAVTIFKAKLGWKLVAMATCRNYAEKAKYALRRLIKADLSRCWMELSERAERFVLEQCGGQHFVVHGSLVFSLLNKPILPSLTDGYHYQREVGGILKAKIIVGTPHIY